jgi:hypothetical protein
MIRDMAEVMSAILMGMYIKDSFLKVRHMVKVTIHGSLVMRSMMDNGEEVLGMVMEYGNVTIKTQ